MQRIALMLTLSLFGVIHLVEAHAMNASSTETSYTVVSYGQQVPAPKGVPVKFPDFTLTHTQTVHDQHPLVSITTNTDEYTLSDTSGATHILKVESGQLPSQPLDFSVNGQAYTLYTFFLPNNERLKPGHIAVFKK